MKVYQLVHTKVPPERSPWGKRDAHTLFYPLDLIDRAALAQLDAHIHYPGESGIAEKLAVFFLPLQSQPHLVILRTDALPQARDVHGRKGLFLCQGFLAPPAVWETGIRPLALLELLEEARFADVEAAFGSPRADPQTGNLAPLELAPERVAQVAARLPGFAAPWERELAGLLGRWVLAPEPAFRWLLHGTPAQVAALMDRLYAYVPNALKPRLGWDCALDGGNLTYHPLAIAGFSVERPVGADPWRIEAATGQRDDRAELLGRLPPPTPYQAWLGRCGREAREVGQVEVAWALSRLVQEGLTPVRAIDEPTRRCFAQANASVIASRYFETMARRLGEALGRGLTPRLTTEEHLEVLLGAFAEDRLAGLAAGLVLDLGLTDREVRAGGLPEGPDTALPILRGLWRGEVPDAGALARLSVTERAALIRYALRRGEVRPWVQAALQADPALFAAALADGQTAPALRRLLLGLIARAPALAGWEDLLSRPEVLAERGHALLCNTLTVWDLIESGLARGLIESGPGRSLCAWAADTEPGGEEGPFTRACLFPRSGIPEALLADPDARRRVLLWLVRVMGLDPLILEELGFRPEEIAGAASAPDKGVLARLSALWRGDRDDRR